MTEWHSNEISVNDAHPGKRSLVRQPQCVISVGVS
jgi:hypothetical protein